MCGLGLCLLSWLVCDLLLRSRRGLGKKSHCQVSISFHNCDGHCMEDTEVARCLSYPSGGTPFRKIAPNLALFFKIDWCRSYYFTRNRQASVFRQTYCEMYDCDIPPCLDLMWLDQMWKYIATESDDALDLISFKHCRLFLPTSRPTAMSRLATVWDGFEDPKWFSCVLTTSERKKDKGNQKLSVSAHAVRW